MSTRVIDGWGSFWPRLVHFALQRVPPSQSQTTMQHNSVWTDCACARLPTGRTVRCLIVCFKIGFMDLLIYLSSATALDQLFGFLNSFKESVNESLVKNQ